MALIKGRYEKNPVGDNLVGHAWERANKCAKCLGALRNKEDGHYHSTGDFAVICCKCRGGGCGKASTR